MKSEMNILLEKTAQGDQQSFKQLYDQLAPKILAFLMKMLADRHIAEDVLQETMLHAWRKAPQFDSNKALASTWIIAIARNRALDQLRKSGRREQVLNQNDYQIGHLLHQEGKTTDPEPMGKEQQGKLKQCLDKLGSDPAACIHLAYINGFSLGEIAVYREHSINTVKSWVRRGLVRLKECMQ